MGAWPSRVKDQGFTYEVQDGFLAAGKKRHGAPPNLITRPCFFGVKRASRSSKGTVKMILDRRHKQRGQSPVPTILQTVLGTSCDTDCGSPHTH